MSGAEYLNVKVPDGHVVVLAELNGCVLCRWWRREVEFVVWRYGISPDTGECSVTSGDYYPGTAWGLFAAVCRLWERAYGLERLASELLRVLNDAVGDKEDENGD